VTRSRVDKLKLDPSHRNGCGQTVSGNRYTIWCRLNYGRQKLEGRSGFVWLLSV
jgi:hypothetical protein